MDARPAAGPARPRPSRSTPLIRVAVAVEPPVLRDVVRELLAEAPDVELVDAPRLPDDPEDGRDPDVVVLSTPDPEDEAVPALMLFRSPRSRVLALSSDARRAFLYELRPHGAALGELGRERLLAAVRAAAVEEAR